jgi:hypothetical protein
MNLLRKFQSSSKNSAKHHPHLSLEHGANNEAVVRFEVLTAVTMKNAVFWDVCMALVRIDISEERMPPSSW